jgi:hypothetical protein
LNVRRLQKPTMNWPNKSFVALPLAAVPRCDFTATSWECRLTIQSGNLGQKRNWHFWANTRMQKWPPAPVIRQAQSKCNVANWASLVAIPKNVRGRRRKMFCWANCRIGKCLGGHNAPLPQCALAGLRVGSENRPLPEQN